MSADITKKDPEATPPGPAPTRAAPIKAVPVRHYGRYVSALIALAALGSVVYAFSQGDINWAFIPDYFFNDRILSGVRETLILTFLSMVIGVVGGVLLAVMRLSKNPVVSSIAWFYIWFFRGTPVLVQLFVWFNLGFVFEYMNLGPFYKDEWSDFMTPFLTALLGLGLNEAAYMAEICRAGLLSVDEGQTEAAHALGMSQGKTLRRIVLPQAMRVIVPPTGNEVINMLKTTSLVAAVQYYELFKHAQDIGMTSGATVEALFLAATWYLILTSILSVGQYYIERHYARGSLRQLPQTPWQKVRAHLTSLSSRSEVTR
ncbi:amino acid ABC transporter permease [Streptomyces sp. DT197]|uniref:amino acid ABC transporter permease n=1 Tax=unclassified Streptomyces TaxID=2593676 RepID=UPI0006463B28|nr:amino acid ABC transporter permease [Streptomyces albidoflavus]